MKRKVIQHGHSTLIISLPRKWTKKNDVNKGDEIEVREDDSELVLSCETKKKLEKVEVNITSYGKMIPRAIHALYKRGADELHLTYDTEEAFSLVRNSLGKEAIGYEILETGKNRCIIKNVSEGTREFNQLLRQTFIILLSMAEEGERGFGEGNVDILHNLIPLEETNNRFTTVLRRYANTQGVKHFDRVGPTYFLLEMIEDIADEYKYMYQFFVDNPEKIKEVHKELLDDFKSVNKMLRKFYELFYKFDPKKVGGIKDSRDNLVKKLKEFTSKIKNQQDILMFQHLMMLTKQIFSLLGPFLILAAAYQNDK